MISSDAIQKKINELLTSFSGEHTLNEIFPPEFLQNHSAFDTAREFFSAAGIYDQRSFDCWLSGTPDQFVSQRTDFESWDDLLHSACKAYANNCLAARRSGKSFTYVASNEFDNILLRIDLLAL